MPKQKISTQRSPIAKQRNESKAPLTKNMNVKFFKSMQKLQHLHDSQYVLKLTAPKEAKQKFKKKDGDFVMKLQKPHWARKSKEQHMFSRGKNINSDEQSTHANGLFESGQIYQNFIHKSKPQLKQSKQQKKTQQETHLIKSRKAQQQLSAKQSLRSKIFDLKLLQKRHEEEANEYLIKSSPQQAYRLQKIHTIETQLLQKQIIQLESKIKLKQESKKARSKVLDKRV